MRMKVSRIETKNLRNRTVSKGSEGQTIVNWEKAIPIQCEVWEESSYLENDTDGQRVVTTKNMKIKGNYTITSQGNREIYNFGTFSLCEGDGICLYAQPTADPDYKIDTILAYKPLRITLARNEQ